MIKGINHIGIAVKNLEDSKALFGKIFSVSDFHEEIVEDQMVAIASFKVGEVLIELTAATSPDSTIAKYIEKRGEGIHHIAFETSDIQSELIRLKSEEISLVNESPQQGAHDMLIAFLHPKSTNSVLMELCQPKH